MTLGRACLILALAIAPIGAIASIYGAHMRRREWIAVGRRSVYALAAVLTVAFAVLEAAFLRSDFSFEVVATHSSIATPLFYKAAAMWSSQEGSLLLWMWLLSLWSSLVLFLTHRSLRELAPYATAVLLGFATFFGALVVFLANPFQLLDPAPGDGTGLQPLLRHPSMMIHPPMLYSGYTLFTVPFAFAIAALITRRTDATWIRATRRFGLAAWCFLGIGILIGARWSWSELGWGGYWAWDPVENAALMPWLAGTAFLHSFMVQEKRGLLKLWNVSLVLGAGILAILGTFLVRSGILQSIHAFGGSTLGKPFLGFIAVLVLGSVALVASRREDLRSPEARGYSPLSRESIFLLNNVLLVGLCFVIFWGTFFPLISEAVTGNKASVGPPWFDRYTVPLAIGLVFLSGLGPLLAWRKTTLAGARRSLQAPATFALLVLVALLLLGVPPKPSALALFACAAFAIGSVVQELYRGVSVRRATTNEAAPLALVSVIRRNRRRYGGYTVHVGIALLFVGVGASAAFQHIRDVRLSPGQSARINGYDVRYIRATSAVAPEKVTLGAVLNVSKHGKHVTTLRTTRGYYPSSDPTAGPVGQYFDGDSTTEVGLKAGLRRDIWTAVQPDIGSMQKMVDGIDKRFPLAQGNTQRFLLSAVAQRYALDPPPAVFRLIVSPLVEWIWLGGIVLGLGALIAIWPPPRAQRRRAPATSWSARLGRELSRA
jgi:cytochrome c-type biogenesis protein CcmF